jgi:hypothetical protein
MKLIIPTELSEIKLSQYQRFDRLIKENDNDDFVKRVAIGCFCNISDKQVGQIPAIDFEEIAQTIIKTIQKKPELKTVIKYNGKKYGFIPNIEEITVDELADCETFLKDVQTFDKAMAVLYRPITQTLNDKYLIEDYNGKKLQPLDLPLDVVLGCTGFFFDLLNDLLNCTQNFIHKEVTLNKKLRTLVENGVGINPFMDSLEVTFLSLKRLAS